MQKLVLLTFEVCINQCLNKKRLTAPLFILLSLPVIKMLLFRVSPFIPDTAVGSSPTKDQVEADSGKISVDVMRACLYPFRNVHIP